MQRIIAEMFVDSLEGVVVAGSPLSESRGDFDLDCEFTLRSDDGVLYRVLGWAVYITLLTAKDEVVPPKT
jgi:hypothetical protein